MLDATPLTLDQLYQLYKVREVEGTLLMNMYITLGVILVTITLSSIGLWFCFHTYQLKRSQLKKLPLKQLSFQNSNTQNDPSSQKVYDSSIEPLIKKNLKNIEDQLSAIFKLNFEESKSLTLNTVEYELIMESLNETSRVKRPILKLNVNMTHEISNSSPSKMDSPDDDDDEAFTDSILSVFEVFGVPVPIFPKSKKLEIDVRGSGPKCMEIDMHLGVYWDMELRESQNV
jgi:hypothetical protein